MSTTVVLTEEGRDPSFAKVSDYRLSSLSSCQVSIEGVSRWVLSGRCGPPVRVTNTPDDINSNTLVLKLFLGEKLSGTCYVDTLVIKVIPSDPDSTSSSLVNRRGHTAPRNDNGQS